ncbi:hypothetical protein EV187_3149 [Agromyces ramosus]|uniref:Uncharacterized protein n=1 Tax=Agromyces ramosus TaxID=33879 RepID=A0A4Q7MAL3_9MICO|nr:hypothetical protein EV187_3149 [Agromyces ramosus]
MSATAPTQPFPPRPYEPGADASGGADAAPAAPARRDPGFRDGVPPGDGRFPGSTGDTTSSQG